MSNHPTTPAKYTGSEVLTGVNWNDIHDQVNLVDGHAGPHFSAYSNTEWSNTDEL